MNYSLVCSRVERGIRDIDKLKKDPPKVYSDYEIKVIKYFKFVLKFTYTQCSTTFNLPRKTIAKLCKDKGKKKAILTENDIIELDLKFKEQKLI